MAFLPSRSSVNSSPMQTMVGIPMVLAKIAVCDLVEPLEVMIPVTFWLSSWTVSDGTKSSVARITGPLLSKVSPCFLSLPACIIRISLTRLEISMTSAARPRM